MAYLKRFIRKETGTHQGNDHVFLDMLTLVDSRRKGLIPSG